MLNCELCKKDDKIRIKASEAKETLVLPHYSCSIHKDYRVYQVFLQFIMFYKNLSNLAVIIIVFAGLRMIKLHIGE